MELKKQVCSAKLSNKIKKLGITTPSIFFREWTGAKDDEIEIWQNHKSYYGIDNVNCYTVAELGEMLPYRLGKTAYYLECWKEIAGKWVIEYVHNDHRFSKQRFVEDTEANARAKCLIYLLEHNLLK